MPVCPRCKADVSTADVNVPEGVALCRACGRLSRLSEVADAEAGSTSVDPTRPPPGAWFTDLGSELRVGATTRHASAFFLVPFMCVWSGGSLGGIYGTQIASGRFNWFMSLFGIPFLLGSILFWSIAMMAICGKVEVTIRGDEGAVFTGVGSIGFRRRFKPSEVVRVYENDARWRGTGSVGPAIVLEGRSRLKFGEGLNEPRRHFVLEMLRTLVLAGARA